MGTSYPFWSGIFCDNTLNTIAADALAPGVAWSSAAMVLTMKD